jgi:hypothetical protein
MMTRTLLALTTINGVGLLLLASIFSIGRPALAQAQETCPLTPGVPPPPDPSVTAQQVEDGSASLMDFAVGARDYFKNLSPQITMQHTAYFGCLLRQEGGPWRSGSTYLIQLTPDGRVFVHAKDMSLSGGLLNPLIYFEILSALGVSLADLANLASPDPATVAAAQAAVFATLMQEPDGAFDATVPIPGLRPGIPGASGHASVYVSATLGIPLLLLAGFELDASHLAQEDIDYGQPTVTARDVVDRETLKTFVTEAGEYFIRLQETGRPEASSQARIALRDPNGPWRHGSVYLYVLERNSNIIMFHGAFPDRFELKPLVPTVRDVVTGEFVLTQVLEAAASSPEGGFVQYFWDDPTDDTDNADIPKVGYAREFSGQLQTPDGRTLPIDVVVGSGFYMNSPGVTAARENKAIETVLPQVMRAMTANTIDAISARIRQATSGAPTAMALNLGGASTLTPHALLANARALGHGTFDLGRLLGESSFSLPLHAKGAAQSSPTGGGLTLWGSGSYRDFAGGNPETLGYDGSVLSATLGIDTRVGADLLAGVSVSRARGAVDYTADEVVTGALTTPLTSINPYLGWQAPGGVDLWATAGYGWGEVEVDDVAADAHASSLTQQMVAAGVSRSLASSEQLIEGGRTSLRFKGETAFTQAEVEEAGTIENLMLSTSRHRLMFEALHARKLASEATLAPSVEVGMRYDGGDGETGAGADIAAGLMVSDLLAGLSVDARVRTLLVHEAEGYEERGVSLSLIYDPSPSTPLGFTARLSPSWGGQTMSGAQALWGRQAMTGLGIRSLESASRMNAEVGYALPVGNGLVGTPRLGVTTSEFGRDYRVGYNLTVLRGGPMNFQFGVDARRRQTLFQQGPDHSVAVRLNMTW